MVNRWTAFDNLWQGFLDLSLSKELDFILLFLLIFAVVYAVIRMRFFKKENNALSAIIAISVAMLATWYLSWEGFDMYIFTYNVFALVLTAGVALVIMLYFIHKVNLLPGFRRALVLLYGVVLFAALNQQRQRFLEGWFDMALIITILLLIIFDKKLNDYINGNTLRR
jgi:hypothetical protein